MSEEKEIFDKQFVYLEWDDVLKGKKVFPANTLPQLRDFVGRNHDSLPTVSKNVCEDTYYPFMSSSGMQYAMVYYDPLYDVKLAWKNGKQIQARSKGSTRNEWVNMEHPGWLDTYEYRVKPEAEVWTACIDDKGVISSMPAGEWNKCKGRQLIEGTEEECRNYALENYCKKCIHESSICCCPKEGCQGFKEKPTVRFSKCSDCEHSNKHIYDEPCRTCGIHSEHYTPKKKKHRWTNRELARWLAEGNGECLQNTIAFAVWNYLAENTDKPVSDYVRIRGWDETEWREPEVEE